MLHSVVDSSRLGNKFACQLDAFDCTKMQLILTEMANEIQEQNAVTFPTHTCVNGSKTSFIERTAIGVFVQVLCGVVALPVYALVSQVFLLSVASIIHSSKDMGSCLKKSVFNENVNSAVSRWHVQVKKMSSKGENDSSHGKQPSIESVLGEGHSVDVQEVEMGAGEQPASGRIAGNQSSEASSTTIKCNQELFVNKTYPLLFFFWFL
ncbi:hypothetical protein L7F22_068827 [Adiantum nelumboides]|nr:hypothetical protein [Adiantum nelumboides]